MSCYTCETQFGLLVLVLYILYIHRYSVGKCIGNLKHLKKIELENLLGRGFESQTLYRKEQILREFGSGGGGREGKEKSKIPLRLNLGEI